MTAGPRRPRERNGPRGQDARRGPDSAQPMCHAVPSDAPANGTHPGPSTFRGTCAGIGGRVELRQIQCFVAVAEELHFGRAATRLHLGQPAVSQQVRRLERELGLELFDRSRRTVRLTRAGVALLDEGRSALRAVNDFSARARAFSDRECDTVRIGIGTALGDRLDHFLDALAEHGGAVRCTFQTLGVRARLDALSAGELDAALVRGAEQREGLKLVTLWYDPLVVALPRRHRLAGRPRLDLRDLADLPLRIAAREVNPVLYDTVEEACLEAGFTPLLGAPFTGLTDTLAEIGAGADCWTLMYPTAVNTAFHRRISVKEIEGTPIISRMSLVLRSEGDPQRMDLLTSACSTVRRKIAGESPNRDN